MKQAMSSPEVGRMLRYHGDTANVVEALEETRLFSGSRKEVPNISEDTRGDPDNPVVVAPSQFDDEYLNYKARVLWWI
jgi:hypothetical protein